MGWWPARCYRRRFYTDTSFIYTYVHTHEHTHTPRRDTSERRQAASSPRSWQDPKACGTTRQTSEETKAGPPTPSKASSRGGHTTHINVALPGSGPKKWTSQGAAAEEPTLKLEPYGTGRVRLGREEGAQAFGGSLSKARLQINAFQKGGMK